MKATWSGGRERAASHSAPATAAAPPNQTAATPIPPQANPGRSKYQPGSPTGSAGTSSKVTVLVVMSRSPRGTHAPASTATPGRPSATANKPGGEPSTEAVTSACETRSASEHQGFVPDSCQPPSARCLAARLVPGGPAA